MCSHPVKKAFHFASYSYPINSLYDYLSASRRKKGFSLFQPCPPLFPSEILTFYSTQILIDYNFIFGSLTHCHIFCSYFRQDDENYSGKGRTALRKTRHINLMKWCIVVGHFLAPQEVSFSFLSSRPGLEQ